MRPRHALHACLLTLVVLVAGCSGRGPDPAAEAVAPDASTSLADGNATVNVTFAPPEPDFFPSPTPALAGQPVRFDASKSTDPEGGNLTYAWDFGDGQTGEGVQPEHVFDAPGEYTVVLNVTSDASQTSAQASLVLPVIDAAAVAPYFTLDDAEGDGVPPHADLVRVAARQSEDDFALIFTLADVTPQYGTASPVLIEFTINGAEYEVYGLGGDGHVHDYARGDDVPGARVAVDEDTDTIGVLLPLSEVAVRASYELSFETRLGEPRVLHGQQAVDQAPDAGTARYEPPA